MGRDETISPDTSTVDRRPVGNLCILIFREGKATTQGKGHESKPYVGTQVIVGLLYNFTYVKMKGPNKKPLKTNENEKRIFEKNKETMFFWLRSPHGVIIDSLSLLSFWSADLPA